MCDYSLEAFPNRLAVRGERLITHRFRSGSIGMASPTDIATALRLKEESESRGWWAAVKAWLSPQAELDNVPAVCIPPGARLRMSRVPDQMQRSQALRAVEDVTFVQLTAEAFNVANHTNYSSVNNIVGADLAPPFNVHGTANVGPSQPLGFTAAFPNREIQLGVRLTF